MEALERKGVTALKWHDPTYPPLLAGIYNPPPVIFALGSIAPQDAHSVTVVGSRRATTYGREVAGILSQDLARNGVTVVSGLARGIDAIAHRASLDAGARTMAVTASGLDLVHPSEHRKLSEEIVERGALISEYPLGTRPVAQNFPRRNRILSGLSLGTLVVEATKQSGTIWTVRHALEQDQRSSPFPASSSPRPASPPNI
jgi:DNA processing protein